MSIVMLVSAVVLSTVAARLKPAPVPSRPETRPSRRGGGHAQTAFQALDLGIVANEHVAFEEPLEDDVGVLDLEEHEVRVARVRSHAHPLQLDDDSIPLFRYRFGELQRLTGVTNGSLSDDLSDRGEVIRKPDPGQLCH